MRIEGGAMRREGVPLEVTSRSGHLICPMCGAGKLGPRKRAPGVSCDSCGCTFHDVVLRILERIIALPDVLGKHACECGHPEMLRLPNGTYHCPACRSEVVPTEPNL